MKLCVYEIDTKAVINQIHEDKKLMTENGRRCIGQEYGRIAFTLRTDDSNNAINLYHQMYSFTIDNRRVRRTF